MAKLTLDIGVDVRLEGGSDWGDRRGPDSGAVIVALEEAIQSLEVIVGPRRLKFEVTGVQHNGNLFTVREEARTQRGGRHAGTARRG
jgi:hypothetical protein